MGKNKLFMVSLILIILILLTMVSFGKKNLPKVIIPPSPTPQIILPAPAVSFSSLKKQVINKLPLTTKGYTIQYLNKGDTFLVIILLNPYQKYKNEAIAWFAQNGIANPSGLNIQWDSTSGVVQP